MKIATNIVGGLLGFVFVALAMVFFLHLMNPPPPLEGSPTDSFMKAFIPTGWMTMVKVFEVIGGILVAIPKTRNFGLLVLGPILINILAYHVLLAGGADIAIPAVLAAFALFLLWAERRSFLALLH